MRKLGAAMLERPWLFCGCGQQFGVTADWLRREAPVTLSGQPRRATAPPNP